MHNKAHVGGQGGPSALLPTHTRSNCIPSRRVCSLCFLHSLDTLSNTSIVSNVVHWLFSIVAFPQMDFVTEHREVSAANLSTEMRPRMQPNHQTLCPGVVVGTVLTRPAYPRQDQTP